MRSDLPHAEVAEAILADPDPYHHYVTHVLPTLYGDRSIMGQQTLGGREAMTRALCGMVTGYIRDRYPQATVEDILLIAVLIERKRQPND